MLSFSLLLTLPLFATQLHAVIIPALGGPHNVSFLSHDLTDESRWEIYAPNDTAPVKRRIVVSTLFPVAPEDCEPVLLDYMPPKTTVAYGQYAVNNGLPNTTFANIQLDFCKLSNCTKKYPLAIFSPGLTGSRFLYSVQAKELASQGYIVVTIDHPYDAYFVEFEDGTTVTGTVQPENGESDLATEVRAKDVSFVIDIFQGLVSVPSLPKELISRADLSKVFVLGHSLGGATAAEVTLLDDRVLGGIDFDGSPWNLSKEKGLSKPFLMVAKGTANGIDETWAPFYEKLSGPKMQYRVEGATHYSYIDAPSIVSVRPLPEEYDEVIKFLLGTVEGKRMMSIITSSVVAFADLVLKDDKGPLLAINEMFPEITVVAENL